MNRSVIKTLFSCLSLLLFFALGCTQPAKPTIAPFTAKPEQPPPAVRTQAELEQLFKEREVDEAAASRWKELVATGPAALQEACEDSLPPPGTSWYEYLRTGKNLSSRLDELLIKDYQTFRDQAGPEKEDASAALRHLVAGTAAFDAGMYSKARTHFRRAVYWMEEATNAQLEARAAAGRADVKIYKGDAYERTMVHFYLGLIAYLERNYAEAKREFDRARQADWSKPSEPERGRFAMIHYWLAKTFLQLGDDGNARVGTQKARECGLGSAADAVFDLQKIRDTNVTIFVQMGAGAAQVPKGADWQETVYQKSSYPERIAEIFIDGQHMGSAVMIADLWHQISTQGESEEQKVQRNKAAGKAVMQSLPYINLIGVAWDVTGDLRSWSLLPDQVHVWSGKIASGEHTITIKFYNENDLELIRYRQSYYYVPIVDGEEKIFVTRAGRDRCAMQVQQ